MKTIKFRAWDADAEWMVYSDKEDDSYWWEINPLRVGYIVGEDEPYPEYITEVQQFTGLHVKNEKEVYEGDVIRHKKWDRALGKYVCSDHEVYFDDELLEFGLMYSNELFNCQFADEYEVIGNIRENPNLLRP